jgi:hypothetical protein
MTGLTALSPMSATAYTPPPTVYTMTDYFPLVPTSQGASTPSAVASISSISSTFLQAALGFTQDALSSPVTPLTKIGFSPPPLTPSDLLLKNQETLMDSPPTLSAASAPSQEVPRHYPAEPRPLSSSSHLSPPHPISPSPLYPPTEILRGRTGCLKRRGMIFFFS